MNKWGTILTGLAALGSLALLMSVPSKAADQIPESDDPIVLALYEWTGQHVTTYIAGHLLERMGYKVEYVTAGSFPSATGLADGDITAALELWSNSMGEVHPKYIAEGKTIDLGDTGIETRLGWLYPKHMEKDCPGLPAWDAFLACSELFATAETFPKGRFLDYPADWGVSSTNFIRSKGLPFVPISAGSEGAMIAELKSSVQRKSPLVMKMWAPHWILSKVEHGWIEMPQDLATEAELVPPRAFNVAWRGLKDKWPAAYRFLVAYKITNAIQEQLIDQIDNGGQDVSVATAKWIDENRPYWEPFVDAATKQ